MENNIEILENFLSEDSCNFIINSFNDSFSETENLGIYGGPSHGIESAWQIGSNKKFSEYPENINKNISIDLLTSSIISIKQILSKKYNVEIDLRTIFYSKMTSGSEIKEHYDNYEPDGSFYLPYGTDPFAANELGLEPDYSAILYLNNNYMGGEIEFPLQKLKLKPNPGTLIFFRGDMNFPHLVNKVESGERINLIMFLWKSDYRKKYFKKINNS
jgi:hypothetical protein